MTIYIVWNTEEWVGTFFQAAFTTREKAEAYFEREKESLAQSGYIEETEIE